MTGFGPVTDWRYMVGIVTGGHFLSHFYNLALPPLFPMIRTEFVVSNTELGVLVAAMSLAGFLQVPMGGLVDRIGGKPVFVAGIAVTSLGVMLVGTASTFLGMVAFSLLAGIGQATFHPADYTLLDSVTAAADEGKSFGMHTFGGYAGFAVAPLIVGGLGLVYGWRMALVITGGVGVVYAAFAAITMDPAVGPAEEPATPSSTPPDTDDEAYSTLRTLLRPGILALVVLYVALAMATVGIKTFTPLLGVDVFGLTEAGGNTMLTAYFTATAISVLIGGVLADRFDNKRLVVVNTGIAAAILWVIVSGIVPITSTAAGVIGFGTLGLAAGLVYPARDRIVNALSGSGSTGKSFGLVYTGGTAGAFVSPILLGAVIDTTTAVVAFGLIGGFFLAGGLLMLPLRRAELVRQPIATDD